MLSTTLDSDLQRRIEEALRTKLSDRAIDDPKLTAAAVVIDVRTGDVLAMVGSRDYFDDEIDGQVNSAVALRQPGSALKPFTYFAAFAKGFLPNSIVPDVPLSFKAVGAEDEDAYAPQNFDRRYHGEMTMRDALANSYNVPAVVTLNEIGLSYYHWLLKRFGITTLNKPPPHYGLSVTLGSGEVTLLELTNAYAALARGGVFLPSRIWNDAPRTAPQPVVPRAKQFAAEVTNILSDPMARRKAFGFIEAMEVEGHRVAIKTGTSFEHRDNWAVGYTPAFAVGVWVGHADGSPMDPLKPSTGASGAAPIWHAVMEILLRGTTPQDFPGMQEVADNRIRPTMMRRDSNAVSLKLKPTSFGITNPVANAVYRIHSYLPIEHQMLRAEASAKQDISLDWYLDGEHIKTTKKNKAAVWIEPEFGRHKLRVEAANGDKQEVVFKVIEGEPI
jgi:membrane carboxypeptidase/penicillin-binding protein PbpC